MWDIIRGDYFKEVLRLGTLFQENLSWKHTYVKQGTLSSSDEVGVEELEGGGGVGEEGGGGGVEG